MTGVFNTIGHETEQPSRDASARFLEGLSYLFRAQAAIERQEYVEARSLIDGAATTIESAAEAMEGIAGGGGAYPVGERVDERYAQELAVLEARLTELGWTMPLWNHEILLIAGTELRALARILYLQVPGLGTPEMDWSALRRINDRVRRVLELGTLLSRVSFLGGHGA